MAQMQVSADHLKAQRHLNELKVLCEKEQFSEALNQVKHLEASLQTITSDPEWKSDEQLKSIVAESYNSLNLLFTELSEKKKQVGEKLTKVINNNKKISAYKSI